MTSRTSANLDAPWVAALAALNRPSRPGPEWFTCHEAADKFGRTRGSMEHQLRAAYRAGKAEKRFGSLDGHAVTFWRIK